ncbi:MAG TPA: FecR family protein [Sunxiuqinia sp.]|nr:FecR family protein [Sunxiuqinia sp.]
MNQHKNDIDKLIAGWGVPESQSQDEAWQQLIKKTQQQRPVRKVNFQWGKWAAAAAAVLVLAFVGLSQSGLFAPQKTNSNLTAQNIWLPDSSLVQLKAHSSVKYNYQLIGGSRMIHLEGEALFDVKKGKPFEVQFPGGKLKVLGTEFNIQAYGKSAGRVDCYRGAVKLTIHNKDYILRKGKSLSFDEKSVDGPFNFNVKNKLNLPDNTYFWNNRPLKEILTLICQRSDIALEAPEEILRKRFTGELNLSNSKQSVHILARAMNLNYQFEANKLTLFETK